MTLVISATDGSEPAERAITVAAAIAKSFNAKLLIVHVSEDISSNRELLLLEQLRVTLGDALEQISRGILARAKAVAQKHGTLNIDTRIGGGEPTKVLVQIAKEENADAIVVGRRGRGQLEGLLLGSVSQKLTCLAPCPVIVVP